METRSNEEVNEIRQVVDTMSEMPAPPAPLTDSSRQERRRQQRAAQSARIPTMKVVDCPKCKKPRMNRYVDEDGRPMPFSSETVEVRGETRLLDICQWCQINYRKEDERFVLRNLKQLQKAMHNRDSNTSDQDFSIDL